MAVKMIEEKDWKELVEGSSKPVLVEFITNTCPVCRQMAPVVQELEEKYGDRMTFFQVNAQTEQYLSMRYGVQGVPTFKFMCKGEPVSELSGGIYPAIIESTIQFVLESGTECAEKRTKISHDIPGYG